jgi:hypothetical protein
MHDGYYIALILPNPTPSFPQLKRSHDFRALTLRIRYFSSPNFPDPSAARSVGDQGQNPQSFNFMPPEKVILLPPTHEYLPSFHVQRELLGPFLDHLSNSGITIAEPPEQQDGPQQGSSSPVAVDISEGTSLERLQDVLDEFLRSHDLPESSQR